METSLQPGSQLQQCKMSKIILLVANQQLSSNAISELPDDVLANILSFLTIKEAVRTSVLSTRWKNLWKLITSFNFDDWNVLKELDGSSMVISKRLARNSESRNDIASRQLVCRINYDKDMLLWKRRTTKYINCVNQILESKKSISTIETFKVHFDLDLFSHPHVDCWVEFAIKRKTERLELDLERLGQDTTNCYPFPFQILEYPSISFLKNLVLNYVDVTKEVLESLLLKCPHLELLSVSWSQTLVGQFVIHEPLNLKHLVIFKCQRLIKLQVAAVNLRSLTFEGPETTRLELENTPHLSVVSFGGLFCHKEIQRFPRLSPTSAFCSRLEKLSLDIMKDMSGKFPKFPILSKLKQLEISMMTFDKYGILDCVSMINACPLLDRLQLQFNWQDALKKKREGEKEICLFPKSLKVVELINREGEKEICLFPKSLKVVELINFRGGITDVEMAIFLFENAENLKEIIIDTRSGCWDLVEEKMAKLCARELATQLCPTAHLVIL